MIRALAWKEYREHRAVWLVMTVLAAAAILMLVVLPWPSGGFGQWRSGPLEVAALVMAGVYAVVCAAMMLAGERESGTSTFLDTLAGRRTDLWAAKVLSGAALTVVQAAIITLVLVGELSWWDGAFLGWPVVGLELLPVMALTALAAFAWGMLLSALCRTALAAVGFAAAPLCASWVAALFAASFTGTGTVGRLVFQVIPAGAALYASWWLYARTDVEREAAGIRMPCWLTLLWLTARQGWRLIAGLAVLGAGLGCLLPWHAIVVWPVSTLVVGVLCGIAAFSPEQAGGWRRFLGDQRLPPGRIWAVKVGVWLVVALAVGLLMLVAGTLCVKFKYPAWPLDTLLIPSRRDNLHTAMQRIVEGNTGEDQYGAFYQAPMIPLWLAYGFGVSLMLGLSVRKRVVALMAAPLVSLLLLGLWMPSFIDGGVEWWQLYAVPALLVVTSRLLVRAWTSERLQARGAALGLAGCWLAVAAWMGGNLWYRIVSMPRVAPPVDVSAYLQSMPVGEAARTGRLAEQLAYELPDELKAARRQVGPLTEPPFPLPYGESSLESDERPPPQVLDDHPAADGRPNPKPVWYSYRSQLPYVLDRGWPPARDGQLARWLDAVCRQPWMENVRTAAALPLGVVRLPVLGPGMVHWRLSAVYQEVGEIMACRAVQLAARGELAASLDHIVWELALSRTLRHRAISAQYFSGERIEGNALGALAWWTRTPGLDPELLRRALAELQRHVILSPPQSEAIQADYVAQVVRLSRPGSVPGPEYGPGPGQGVPWDWVALAVQAPWERARYRRLLDLTYAHLLQPGAPAPRAAWNWDVWFRQVRRLSAFLGLNHDYRDVRARESLLRRHELTLALVLYQTEHRGRVAPRLAALVPADLPELPDDPVARSPYGYALSSGEALIWGGLALNEFGNAAWTRKTIHVAPGQAVIRWRELDGREDFSVVPTWVGPKQK